MAITRTYTGQNPDGTPHFDIVADGPVVMTGPIYGTVVISDGTVYEVNDQFIEVQEGHQDEVAAAISQRFEVEGHPDFINDPTVDNLGFTFIPTEA